MKNLAKLILMVMIVQLVASACHRDGHKEHHWQPRTGKKMKAGHNR
jgi:hypothetical protein